MMQPEIFFHSTSFKQGDRCTTKDYGRCQGHANHMHTVPAQLHNDPTSSRQILAYIFEINKAEE